MKLVLAPGAFLGEHTHVGNSETIYVLSGAGTMLCDGVEEPLTPACAITARRATPTS